MKVCPACRTTFDDSQNFCLTDGTPLVPAETEAEKETVVAPRESNVQHRSYQTPTPVAAPEPAGKKPKTGLIVAGTALVTLLLVGLGAGGWWLMSRNNGQTARTNANTILMSNANSAVRTSVNLAVANSKNDANANESATNSAVNAPNVNTETAESSPTPERELLSAEAATIRKEVSGAINSWANEIESGNLNGHLSFYADTLDYYYTARGFPKNQVRADKQRAFADFDDIEFKISNVKITPDASGNRATVVYDKEWVFSNDERSTEGKVQSQLTLQKIGGRWLIVGERDLRVYYQESH